jgi:hypothetical protein
LPPALDLNAVEMFEELAATGSFDDSLGYLASKQRASLHKEWDRKNRLAEQARGTELEAIRKRRSVGEHLGFGIASALHARE